MTLRQEKVNELLRELASEFLLRASNRTSMITVTRVDVSKDMKSATIYLSVYPENDERGAFDFVRRNLGHLRDEIRGKLSMRVVPFFDCKIDDGEKNRRLIDDLSENS